MKSFISAIFKTLILSLAIVAQVNFAYAQSQGAIIPNGKATYLDNNGNPLSAGKVFYYIPTTTTPKTTYQDVNQTIPNTNPIILDAAGRSPAQIFGAGNYRQLVQDQNGNVIWDVTTTTNGTGNVVTATGDGDLVGTIKPWAGMTAPNQYMFTYGQQISRINFSTLFAAITSTQQVSCNSGNNTVTGLSDTTNFWIGMTVELACVSGGVTTITSKTSSSVTLAVNANVTQVINATFFPWGNGNGTTTFSLPDFRGLVPVGNNIMGGTASSNLSIANFGTPTPNASGAQGGQQSVAITLALANLPLITSINNNQPITVSAGGQNIPFANTPVTNSVTGSGAFGNAAFANGGTWNSATSLTQANNIAVFSQNTTDTPFNVTTVTPSKTVNFIIKVTPDANSATATGVTDINGMTGSIGCGSQVNCTGNIINFSCNIFNSTTAGCVPASGGGSTNFLRADGVFAPVGGGTGGRIKLAAPATFYIDTIGTDISSCGLSPGAAACRTRGFLYNILASNYDLGGQTVTVQLAAGTYTDSLQVSGNLLVGQAAATGLIFTGDCTAGHTNDVLIQPANAVGYTYSADGGSGYRIQCQKLDQTTQVRGGGGSDMTVAGHGSKLYFGNPSMHGSPATPDLTFGCNINPYNGVTLSDGVEAQFDNDYNVDVTACQVTTTGTPTNGSATISSVGTTTNVVQFMNVIATNVPNDAYVISKTVNSVTFVCIYTTPCQANGSPGSVPVTFTGGGQAFIDFGNVGKVNYNTNGQPDFSIIQTLAGNPFYLSGWFFDNEGSIANAQAITTINPNQAHGACSFVVGNSLLDTNFQGIPYLPCNGQIPQVQQSSVSLTAGANTITVASTTGIKAGMIVSDIATPTATFTAGSASMTVSSGTGIIPGMHATGPGILAGATVASVVGTTVTLNACGGGPKCPSNSPLYITESSPVTVYFTAGLLKGNTVVSFVNSGTVFTISGDTPQGMGQIQSSGTANLWFQGQVIQNSTYK